MIGRVAEEIAYNIRDHLWLDTAVTARIWEMPNSRPVYELFAGADLENAKLAPECD